MFSPNLDFYLVILVLIVFSLSLILSLTLFNSWWSFHESNSELGSYWISTINEVVNYNDKNKGVIHFSDQDGFNVDMFNLGAWIFDREGL